MRPCHSILYYVVLRHPRQYDNAAPLAPREAVRCTQKRPRSGAFRERSSSAMKHLMEELDSMTLWHVLRSYP
jgi:hypothetical protein